uniref:Uncharacterized protein n=1 Tax=Anguilla anguilla TaxID=7936 RepID=A0A0E9XYD1_ANGAN
MDEGAGLQQTTVRHLDAPSEVGIGGGEEHGPNTRVFAVATFLHRGDARAARP